MSYRSLSYKIFHKIQNDRKGRYSPPPLRENCEKSLNLKSQDPPPQKKTNKHYFECLPKTVL